MASKEDEKKAKPGRDWNETVRQIGIPIFFAAMLVIVLIQPNLNSSTSSSEQPNSAAAVISALTTQTAMALPPEYRQSGAPTMQPNVSNESVTVHHTDSNSDWKCLPLNSPLRFRQYYDHTKTRIDFPEDAMTLLGETDRPTRISRAHMIQQGADQKIISDLGDAIWRDLANNTLICNLANLNQLTQVQQYLATHGY